jgi:hypothetical protein
MRLSEYRKRELPRRERGRREEWERELASVEAALTRVWTLWEHESLIRRALVLNRKIQSE